MNDIINFNKNQLTFRRKKVIMGTHNNKRTQNNQNGLTSVTNATNSSPTKNTDRMKTTLDILGIIGGVLSALTIIVGLTFYISSTLTKHSDDIENLEDTVVKIEDSVTQIQDTLNEQQKMLLTLLATSGKINTQTLLLSDSFIIKTESKQNEIFLSQPNWSSYDVIAKDPQSDKLFEAIELSNTPVIFSYEQNGKEVYFYGQYNEYNQWNGECILNIYDGNNLEIIFEGIYNNGKLFSYKRLSCENIDTWVVTDRIKNDTYNSGETWIYTKTNDYVKYFTIDTVTEQQIINIEGFLKSKNEIVLSYYNGNTSNGYYNDDTGNAYLITYFLPEVIQSDNNISAVKTLYKGRFLDGQFNDTSYDSWYISRDIDTTYMYYKGGFDKGKVNRRYNKKEEKFENNLTHEQIDEYLNQYGFSEYSDNFVTEYENKE